MLVLRAQSSCFTQINLLSCTPCVKQLLCACKTNKKASFTHSIKKKNRVRYTCAKRVIITRVFLSQTTPVWISPNSHTCIENNYFIIPQPSYPGQNMHVSRPGCCILQSRLFNILVWADISHIPSVCFKYPFHAQLSTCHSTSATTSRNLNQERIQRSAKEVEWGKRGVEVTKDGNN